MNVVIRLPFVIFVPVVAIFCAYAAPAVAQVELPPEYLAGALVADPSEDPDEALDRLDALLEQLTASGDPDPRIVYDISQLQIEILIDAGRDEEAAQLLLALADFIAGYRDELGIDPGPLLSDAADRWLAAGNPAQATAALQILLAEQRDGGYPRPVLAATLTRMVEIATAAGDGEQAERLRDEIAAVNAPDSGDVTRGDDDGHVVVEVHYATDRKRTTATMPARVYGYDRAEGLDYGIATVTIPKSHRPGTIDRPSLWRGEFSVSPSKHIVLQAINPMTKDVFFESLESSLAERTKKEAFVFIHGYNVTFEHAAKRAAQLAYDMNFAGLPVLYSWPSRGATMGYIRDTAVVRLSGRRLSRFLDDLVSRTGAERIHIIAHSMGNRALTDALELMALRRNLQPEDPPIFGQIVFAAPDVDAGLFAAMTPTIRPLAERLTLYASAQDWALYASRKLHGDAPRAGQAGADVLVEPEFDSVDMSLLGADMLAHNYYSSALLDIFTLFWRNLDPAQRCGLEPNERTNGRTAWIYHPERCSDQAALDVIATLAEQGVVAADGVHAVVARAVGDSPSAPLLEAMMLGILGF